MGWVGSELKNACGHLVTPKQHLYSGLARRAVCGLFHFNRNGLPARIACWPGEPTLARDRHQDGQRDGQGEKLVPPLQAMLLRGIKIDEIYVETHVRVCYVKA